MKAYSGKRFIVSRRISSAVPSRLTALQRASASEIRIDSIRFHRVLNKIIGADRAKVHFIGISPVIFAHYISFA